MNIFIIGYSQVGKTTLSKLLLCELLNSKECLGKTRQYISAGEWVRSQCDPKATVEELTKFAIANLANNPNACVDFIHSKYNLAANYSIIDGIRNPFDFVKLFNPQKDVIITLDNIDISPSSPFEEQGYRTIKSIISFGINSHLIESNQVITVWNEKDEFYYNVDCLNKASNKGELIKILASVIINKLTED